MNISEGVVDTGDERPRCNDDDDDDDGDETVTTKSFIK